MAMPFKNPFKEEIAERPARRVLRAPPDDGLPDDKLLPNEFYFEIRLCEMHMRQSSEAGRSFVPRALAVTECLYNREELTLPIAVGQQLLEQLGTQIETGNGSKAICFTNCLVAGPMPYRGADINFFGGLYRVESGNWADSAFDLVADLTKEVGLDVSRYFEVGRKLVVGLPALLGVGSDDWRFGHYGPIYTESDGFFDRYLVLLGTDGTPLNGDTLEVQRDNAQESLHVRSAAQSEPFSGRDFALFRLRSRATRGDYTRFQFNKRFDEAKNLLTNGHDDRAEWAHLQLLQEISECGDLTDRHKLQLVATFDLKFEEWAQSVRSRSRGKRSASAGGKRGNSDDAVRRVIGTRLETARQKHLADETVATFSNLQRNWERVRQLPAFAGEFDLENKQIEELLNNKELQGLVGGTSADFVETIRATRLHSS